MSFPRGSSSNDHQPAGAPGEPSPQPLQVSVLRRPAGVTRVVAAGEIDWASVGTLDRAVEHEPAADTRALIVDWSGVTYCASCGLHLLVSLRARAEAAGVPLALVVTTYAVRRALEASGMWPLFSIYESHDAALASVGAHGV